MRYLVSDGSLVNPVEDKVVSLGSLELRSHVASTVNGSESEITSVRLKVTTDLSIDKVRSPGLCDSPTESRNPVLGSKSRYGTISVT